MHASRAGEEGQGPEGLPVLHGHWVLQNRGE